MTCLASLLGILGVALYVVFNTEQHVQAQQFINAMSPYSSTDPNPSSSRKQLQYKTGSGYKELPEPGTPAAQALLGNPSTSGSVRQVYTYSQDSTVITPELTAVFFQRLQQQLQATPGLAGSSDSKGTIDLQPFIKVAADMLSYLRYMRSTVLLDLLRKFCISNGSQLNIATANAVQLRSEVGKLLNQTTLDAYYQATSNRDGYRGGSSRSHYPSQESAQADAYTYKGLKKKK